MSSKNWMQNQKSVSWSANQLDSCSQTVLKKLLISSLLANYQFTLIRLKSETFSSLRLSTNVRIVTKSANQLNNCQKQNIEILKNFEKLKTIGILIAHFLFRPHLWGKELYTQMGFFFFCSVNFGRSIYSS